MTTMPPRIVPLKTGDHMTRDEFEARYHAMPGVKAELIEGIVYVASPVRMRQHSVPHTLLALWLGTYWAATPGTVSGTEGTIRLDLDNEPQPDGMLMLVQGGTARITDDDYVEGGPELVAEVAASSVSMDRNTKMQVYRRNGIREYVLIRTEDQVIDWFVLRAGQYEPLLPGADGILRSEVFPGLWLEPAAFLALNVPRVLEVLQLGLATPEHAAFVTALQPPPAAP
jgi:Uma2 family endonuclease